MNYDGLRPEPGLTSHAVEGTKLVLYRLINGIPTFKDSDLISVFERAKRERLLPLVMYNTDPEMPIQAFVRMYTIGAGRLLSLVFHDGKLAGWAWLDDMVNRTARSHFCFFRWVSQGKLANAIGRAMHSELFNLKFRNGTMLQVIRAEMPAFNKPGLCFLTNVGFKAVGQIPNAAYRFSTGTFYPMVYLYATKEMIERRTRDLEPITQLVDCSSELAIN
jgi:hypothetical protein